MTALTGHIAILNAPHGVIPLGSAFGVRLDGLRDAHHPDTWINTATVVMTVYDNEDAALFTITLNYLSGSNGRYEGTADVDDITSNLTEGAYYTLRTVATVGGAVSGTWQQTRRAAYHAAL